MNRGGGEKSRLKIRTLEDAGDRARWKLERYTGPTQSGMTTDLSEGPYYVGQQVPFSAAYWTTAIDYNRPWAITDSTNGAAADVYWDNSWLVGELTMKNPGTLNLGMKIYKGDTTSSHVTTDKVSCQIKLRFPEGTYFVRNKQIESYMQSNGGSAEMQLYNANYNQKWIFTHLEYEYYSIKSADTGLALTVPSGKETSDNAELALSQFSSTNNNQKWKIILTSNNAYKIKAKSSESYTAKDLVMDAASITGSKVCQREYLNNSSYYDEWYIISPSINVGFSTDNYSADVHCSYIPPDSYRYANVFYYYLHTSIINPSTYPLITIFNKTHHYNKDSIQTASKNDFATNGAIDNDIDFMIYLGHGLTAGDSKGNFLHYNCAPDGSCHTTEHTNPKYNVYTSEVRFGSSESNLRWVWLYTCNFLNTDKNDYVTDDNLKEMMTGAHIVMGYGTRAKLCDAMVTRFAQKLRDGGSIINSYFYAPETNDARFKNDPQLLKVLYIPQAENETIYSPRVRYEYNSSNVQTATHVAHGIICNCEECN